MNLIGLIFLQLVVAVAGRVVSRSTESTVARRVVRRTTESTVESSVLLPSSSTTGQECIALSLSSPRWEITGLSFIVVDFIDGGRSGDVKFTAYNAAVDLTRTCTVNNVDLSGARDDTWYNCSVPDTEFQFSLENFAYELRVRGTWTCGTPSRMVFVGKGVIAAPKILRCDDYPDTARGWESSCRMGDSYVPVGLSSPIAIHPEQPLVPVIPTDRAERCVERSDNPSWKIENLSYGPASPATLSFTATNLANNEKVQCSVDAKEQNLRSSKHVTNWLDCTSSSSRITSTQFMFDADHGILGIKQAWKCPDSEPPYDPTSFAGSGYLVGQLKCTGTTGCSLASATINGFVNAPVLPHTSYSRSCTLNSINATVLTLESYKVEGTGAQGAGTFTLQNHGSGDQYVLSRIPVQDDGTWHECVAGADPLPWQLVACSYNLDSASGLVAFRIQWYCDDRDPNHAILFKAEAAGKLPAENAAGVGLDITSLTWASSNGPMDRGPTLPWT